jgi:hypothetical protein
MKVAHTKAFYWTRFEAIWIEIIYLQSVLIISNLKLYYNSSSFSRDLYTKLLREFNVSDISHVKDIRGLRVYPSNLALEVLWNPFISEEFLNVRSMRCFWWDIQFLNQTTFLCRLSPVVYIPLIQSYKWNMEVPYFSIDKAHLMYNAHPKIFDIPFDV